MSTETLRDELVRRSRAADAHRQASAEQEWRVRSPDAIARIDGILRNAASLGNTRCDVPLRPSECQIVHQLADYYSKEQGFPALVTRQSGCLFALCFSWSSLPELGD